MRRYLLIAVIVSGMLTARAETPLLPGVPAASQATSAASPQSNAAGSKLDLRLPLEQKSVRFAVIGDSGTGDREQYEVAQQMELYREKVGFDMVIMLGDNIYGGHSPRDFARKFEIPYKPLLDAGVKFYASLGNHDDPNDERLYKPFNMGGERYYAFRKNDVAFFALDSNYMDPKQLQWVEENLRNSQGKWKICFFHHPLYNDGRHHGPDTDLRTQLLPLFQRYGVNAVFSGHEHVYERMKPENNISYFVLGNSGKLMPHDSTSFRPDGERLRYRPQLHAGRNFRRQAVLPDHLPQRHDNRFRHGAARRIRAIKITAPRRSAAKPKPHYR